MSFLARLGSSNGARRSVSVALGVCLIFVGLDKIDWLTEDGCLMGRLQEWREAARPLPRWYLENVALPGAPVFARLIPIAELAAGSALVLGFKVRLAAALALLMVLNFHFASDIIYRYDYLINAYGLPILGGLLALAVGGAKLPFSLSK